MHLILSGTVSLFLCYLFHVNLAQTCGTCQSFGIDFISDGSYFQNSLSTDPFTAVQEFEGCANDTSHNVLVDPKGKQYECSMTPMSPDDTPEQLTCPINKNQLYSGKWHLLVLSNNGDCAPIDYQRDFYLKVGPQQTVTVLPTIFFSTTVTPYENSAATSTQIITSTAPPTTTTVPRVTLHPTVTIRPLPIITKVTKAIFTITKTRLSATVVATSTSISKAKCHYPRQRHTADPLARIVATVLGDLDSILGSVVPQPTGLLDADNFKRAVPDGRSPDIEEGCDEHLALHKRAPDEPTISVTDTSAPPVISTVTTTAPTQTIYITSTMFLTTTFTPIVTVRRGIDVSISTVTAPQRTLTKTIWTVATTTRFKTQSATLTITSTVTPSQAARRCSADGGTMY